MADWTLWLGYLAAACTVATYSMKLIIPLRVMGIVTNLMFAVYAYMTSDTPSLLLQFVVLPINFYRLHEMFELTRKIRRASAGDLSIDWLKPYMSKRFVRKGEVLFRKGDSADMMFCILTGVFRLAELGIDIRSGAIVGELGMLAPDNRRTQTLVCLEDGDLLQITYFHIQELYFQNPQFGFYLLRLTTQRLFQNIASLEAEVSQLKVPAAPRG